MSVCSAHLYDRNGRLRQPHDIEAWAIYAAFVHGDSGGLVKIGVTTSPLQRVFAVHSGSPYPVEGFVWSWAGTRSSAFQIEAFAHKCLADRQSRGEWFRFDYASKDDQRTFHDTMRQVYETVLGRPLAWTRGDMEQVRALNSLKTRARKVKSKAKRQAERRPWRA